jgi:hypothetical protein
VRHRVESTASLRAGSLKRGEERERAEIRARSNASITAPLVNTMPPTTTLPERLCSVFGKRTCNQSKDPPALVHARARLRHFAPPLGVVRLLRREFARHYPACSLAAIKFAALVTRWRPMLRACLIQREGDALFPNSLNSTLALTFTGRLFCQDVNLFNH